MGEFVPWLQAARKAEEERSVGMTRVGVLCIEKISDQIPMPSDTAALSRVLEAKSASLRAQRAFCYSLLERLYADTFHIPGRRRRSQLRDDCAERTAKHLHGFGFHLHSFI